MKPNENRFYELRQMIWRLKLRSFSNFDMTDLYDYADQWSNNEK